MGRRHILFIAIASAAALLGCAKGGTSLDEDAIGMAGREAESFCGNGELEKGESCDGDDLNGETCKGLGHGGGMLSCDPATCTYDTQMCTPKQDTPQDPTTAGTAG